MKEIREFFQTQPVSDRTEIKIDTTPKLDTTGMPGTVSGLVEVDGARVSEKTPFVVKGLTPGAHRVTVSAKGYIGQEMEIDAKEGQTTPLSLALQPLSEAKSAPAPREPRAPHRVAKEEPAPSSDPHAVASADYAPHIVILTATPASAVVVDGAPAGTSIGVHLHLDHASGEVVIGGAASFNYYNRGNRVSVRPNVDAKGTLSVDGQVASGKGKVFDLDQRPRRIEITSAGGVRQVLLLKLAE